MYDLLLSIVSEDYSLINQKKIVIREMGVESVS